MIVTTVTINNTSPNYTLFSVNQELVFIRLDFRSPLIMMTNPNKLEAVAKMRYIHMNTKNVKK